ncbi:MAG TPA: hypothetical protein VFI84_02725 [Candidatus Saccharimonadales bacterium]|nr:hypothetical protein [Candidatus Saccharimonadales bacterium]
MRLSYYKYSLKHGVQKIKTRTAIMLSVIGLALGGGAGMSLLAFSSAHAATPGWQLNPSAIVFTCGGAPYGHHLNTVSENQSTGDFTGTGSYNADSSYTWNATGNVSDSNITFQIVYTGTNAGYTLNGVGTIASDGSVSGTVDGNCESFTMPAGSATHYCLPTGFVRDGIDLTARQIGGDVTGTLDATGCNIGVYYNSAHTGNVTGATVFGANYFGVVNDGTSVDVTNSTVRNIGEVPFNGTQHGVGVYYTNGATGTISGNTVNLYQKGGIVANGDGTVVTVSHNTVTGLGPKDFIAQNGIQVSRGATGSVNLNTVSDNEYTGANFASSGGILVFGGCGTPVSAHVEIGNNTVTNNDVGIYAVNYNDDCDGPTNVWTRVNVHNNVISKDSDTNVSGWDGSIGYQAGIDDVGKGDNIHNNKISGAGYTQQTNPVVYPIDTTMTSKEKVHNNTF